MFSDDRAYFYHDRIFDFFEDHEAPWKSSPFSDVRLPVLDHVSSPDRHLWIPIKKFKNFIAVCKFRGRFPGSVKIMSAGVKMINHHRQNFPPDGKKLPST